MLFYFDFCWVIDLGVLGFVPHRQPTSFLLPAQASPENTGASASYKVLLQSPAFSKTEPNLFKPKRIMNPVVSIIMGSRSDWPTMSHATTILQSLHIDYETQVVSAHRTPQRLVAFAGEAPRRGIKVIIAGAGGAAHLPGMTAAMTHLPVVGVPVSSKALKGMDSLLSIVQMPRGVCVATQAIGESGAYNAGLMAAQILAIGDAALSQRLQEWRQAQTDAVPSGVEG
ncbi:MAG: 5-(carboxyamino)imidazole ribonucleotide mutase [Cellvibrionaceae bacterium]|jgi:5-(carboxyamino)imidazole ribonucleotide mutase